MADSNLKQVVFLWHNESCSLTDIKWKKKGRYECGIHVSPDNCREKYKDRWKSTFKFGNLVATGLLDLYLEAVTCFGDYDGDNTVKLSSLDCKRFSQGRWSIKEGGWALA